MREIYEGDIVSIDEYWDGDVLMEPELGIVKFSEGCFSVFDLRDYFIDNLIDILTDSKILGNIYENPELLKEA